MEQLDRKSKKKYKKALQCLTKGERQKGILKLEELVTKYPAFEKGAEKLVGIYMDQGETEKATVLLERLHQNTEVPIPKIAMTLSYTYEEKGNYDRAIQFVADLLNKGVLTEEQRTKVEHRLAELEFRKDAYAKPVEINPIKLSTAINTEDIEYHPGFNADGSVMIYVKVGKGALRNENLYTANKVGVDSFTLGVPIASLNTTNQEGAFSLSQDGNVLVYTTCDYKDSVGGCDLYIAFRKGNSWSEAQNMGSVINSRFWDASPSLSSDKRTIYFSSKRPGGYGGSDIYKVELDENNKWQKPENLGPQINTNGNDEAPFIHPDGTSLYFISDGHVGLGSYDIYVSKMNNAEWQVPVNLGYPINTDQREGGIFVDLRGQRAYFSSQIDFTREGQKISSGDIYYFDLPEQVKPELISYVRVEVRDGLTKGLINAKAELKSLGSDKSLDKEMVVGGVLLTTIQPGEYALTISKQGYLFHSENIVLDKITSLAEPFSYQVYLQPIVKEREVETSVPIILNNIFFASGSSELLSSSDSEIKKLVELLNENPTLKIKILGHTDNVGSEQDNLALSSRRAKAVLDRLLSAGIIRSRLQYEGKGENSPLAANDTEAGRQRNRRTEFILID